MKQHTIRMYIVRIIRKAITFEYSAANRENFILMSLQPSFSTEFSDELSDIFIRNLNHFCNYKIHLRGALMHLK